MWSSGEDNSVISHNRVLSSSSPSSSSSSSKSSSTSSSSSSCPSPFSSSVLISTPKRKTMEEVWKDISLASLHDRPTREDGPKNTSRFRGMILQDFLARPFKEPSTNPPDIDIGLFGSPSRQGPPTALSLNSGPEFQYLDTMGFHNPSTNSPNPIQSESDQCYCSATASFISDPTKTPFDAFRSSSFCKKRVPETEENSGDRRHKRMIKNRESAARSRARKQAYTNELELKINHLTEENDKLKKQQKELYLAASAQVPTKNTLYRTTTAPF